jgi:type IV secretory pathway VirB6-like protein
MKEIFLTIIALITALTLKVIEVSIICYGLYWLVTHLAPLFLK